MMFIEYQLFMTSYHKKSAMRFLDIHVAESTTANVVSSDGKKRKHDENRPKTVELDASCYTRVAERISQMVRMPLENAEPFQIVHYDGQKYDYHFDSFDTSDAEYFDGYVKTVNDC